MVRTTRCSKVGLNKGVWSKKEDKMLLSYIEANGEGKWKHVAQRSGLQRCEKSCRLRWVNYLKPGIKRGNITEEEEDLIVRMHKLLGNRWSLIAGRIPGRTDNEIKNYWNTVISKRFGKSEKKRSLKNSYENARKVICKNDQVSAQLDAKKDDSSLSEEMGMFNKFDVGAFWNASSNEDESEDPLDFSAIDDFLLCYGIEDCMAISNKRDVFSGQSSNTFKESKEEQLQLR